MLLSQSILETMIQEGTGVFLLCMAAKVSDLAPFYCGFFFHEVHFHTYIGTRAAENKTKNLGNNVSFQRISTIYVGVDAQ